MCGGGGRCRGPKGGEEGQGLGFGVLGCRVLDVGFRLRTCAGKIVYCVNSTTSLPLTWSRWYFLVLRIAVRLSYFLSRAS